MKRRDLIKLTSASFAAVQLPLHLTLARSAIAQASGSRPKRVMFVFTPHGGGPSWDQPNLWQPNYSNGNLSLNEFSRPLESVKDRLLFIDGMSMYNNPFNIGDGHKQGNRKAMTANGNDSLDIVIGDHFRNETPFGSVQMGVMPNRFDHHDTPAYRNGQQVPFWDNPNALYNQLFSAGNSNSASGNSDANVLSNTAKELASLQRALGQMERERLEAHADALSQLEQRLNSMASQNCQNPDVDFSGVPNDPNAEYAIDNISRAMQQIAAQALACDLTRSVHFLFGHEANGIRLPGFSAYDHDASHNDLNGEWKRYRIYWAEQLRNLITTMANTSDGGDSVLDNTLLMHYSEIGHSNSHDFNRVPFMLAGGKAFGLQTGKKVTYNYNGNYAPNGEPHSHLLATIGQRMGLNMTRFGDGARTLNNQNEIFA